MMQASPLARLCGLVACLFVLAASPLSAEEKAAPAAVEPSPFDDFDDEQDYPAVSYLKQFLAEVPGERHDLGTGEIRIGNRERGIGKFYGVFRVNAQVSEGSALRLSLLKYRDLQIHVWNGEQGISLRYYPEYSQTWAALAATREPGKAKPKSLTALLGTTGDLYRRSGLGTFDLNFRDGKFAMTHGDLTLLCVPWKGPPGEIYLEGSALVRGLAVVPSAWKPEPAAEGSVVMRIANPGELAWEVKHSEKSDADKITFTKLPDGRVELSAGEKTRDAQATFALNKPKMLDIIFQVEDPEPGTGLCVTDAEGKHLARLGFLRHRESGSLIFEGLPTWSGELEKNLDGNRQPVPHAGTGQWYRLVCGAGRVKCFVSADGIHWSQPHPGVNDCGGPCTRIGLYCVPGEKKRAIKLRSIEVRQLASFAALSAEATLAKVDRSKLKFDSFENWQQTVRETKPADAALSDWRRACAVRTIAEGCSQQLGRPVLDLLIADAIASTSDSAAILQLLEEAMLVYPQDWDPMDTLIVHAARLATAMTAKGEPRPFTTLSHAALRWPLWSQRRLPVFSDELLRRELTTLASDQQWDEVRALVKRMRYWNAIPREGDQPPWSPEAEHLIDWAEATAADFAPPKNGEKPSGRMRNSEIRPLVEHLSRDGFTVMAELRAALDSQSYREAAQMITATSGAERLGLLPHGKDPWLLVSYPVAVESAMRELPPLRDVMQEQYAKIGRLRLNQANGQGDARGMIVLASQFAGQELAAEANRWLGDRALSAGDFGAAQRYYRAAMVDAVAAADRDAIQARMRLAGALVGRDVGKPVASAVQFGKTTFTPAEFEQMADQLRKSRAGARPASDSATASAMPPGRYEAKPWAKVEGQEVKRPPQLPDRGLDWAGRLTSVLVAGRQMFVSNRIEQIAYNLDDGKQQWIQRSTADDNHSRWPLVPMQPVLNDGKLFVRRLTANGPELACLDAADGRVIWTARPDDGVISDPLLIDGRLFLLSARYDAGRVFVQLVGLEPNAGHLRSRVMLAEFRDLWRQQFPCQATVADDRIVASLGGCVLCCDTLGQVHWLRRQVWSPPSGMEHHDGRTWLEQEHPVPLVSDGRVYVTQPGVFGVECLDLRSGRPHWRQAIGGLTRLVGEIDGRLIVQAGVGVLGLDMQSGNVAWWQEAMKCLDVQTVGSPGAVLLAHLGETKDGKDPKPIVLTWLDAKTGDRLGSAPLGESENEIWLRPLVIREGRQWALKGKYGNPAQREILELKRAGDLPNEQ